VQSIQKSPRLIDPDQARQALLRGRELTAIRDAAASITHYRFIGTPACVDVETFETLLSAGLIEEVIPDHQWALAERVRTL
jgi:hypothetical protein